MATHTRTWALLLTTALAPTYGLSAGQPIVIQENVSFREVNGRTLMLDLAKPERKGRLRPAVIVVHGGAWVVGSRKTMHIYEDLAERGFVAVRVDYRLATENPFPAQLGDLKSAVRWLRANAKEHHIDPARIGVVGYSAGGHLAAMLGVSNDDEKSRVQAVVTHYGISDVDLMYRRNVTENRFGPVVRLGTRTSLKSLLGGTPEGNAERFRKASPARLVGEGTPPLLITHGLRDRMLDPEQAVVFAKAAMEAGVEVELRLYEGAGHCYGTGDGGELGDRADEATYRFLWEHLAPRAVARK